MNWLWKWLDKRLRRSRDIVEIEKAEPGRIGPNRFHTTGINFTIYKATGGYVVEFVNFDPLTDRRQCNLHVVADDDDLGNNITSIITLEAMRSLR